MTENTLDIDQEQLAAEAAAVELPPTADAGQELPGNNIPGSPGELAPQSEASWASSTPSLVFLVDKFVCPAWELTADEKAELAAALAPVLDDLFPGGLGSEKWAPYLRLLTVAGSIVVTRIGKDGKIKPLRAPSSEPAADEAPPGPFMTAGSSAGGH